MEAYVWASTDMDLGICIGVRVFGSMDDAQADAQDCIGDACPIAWTMDGDEEALGEFTDTNGVPGMVRVSLVKVRL